MRASTVTALIVITCAVASAQDAGVPSSRKGSPDAGDDRGCERVTRYETDGGTLVWRERHTICGEFPDETEQRARDLIPPR